MQQLERAARMAQQPRLHLLPMLLLLLLPLMSPGLVLPAAASVCAPADRDALLSFKAEVEDRAGALGSWDPAQSCCGWAGVACDPAGRVTEVRIDDEEEEGAATGAAGEWWLVRRTGPAAAPDAVGRTLGRIATLRVLKLARTDLRGDSLPRAAWPQLRVVALRGLNLRGGVPRQWGGWRQVREVNVRGGNALAGGLPPELCRLANLQVLQLSGKAGSGGGGLTGPVPPCLLALPNLKALVLSFNRLSGPVPAPAPGGRLEVLRLDHNRLRGGVPEALGSLPKLKVLDLQGNVALSGPIPASLSRLAALQELRLGSSSHGGSGAGDDLAELDEQLFSEAPGLRGDVAALHLEKLTRLRVLHIRGTSLTGSIPASIGGLSKLVDLRLDHNRLQGSIPSSIGKLRNLEHLFLSFNRLTGPIPHTFTQLSSAITINLSHNNLSGLIPPGLGTTTVVANSSSLLRRHLDLSWNALTGHFPASLLSSGLSSIRLSHNLLTGLPAGGAAALKVSQPPGLTLRSLYVDFNRLAGLLPPWAFQLPSLVVLDLSNNRLTSPFPSLVGASVGIRFLNLSANNFGGPIPLQFTHLTSVQLLDLSDNRLEGTIPSNICGTLTGRSSLEVLDLSKNRLHGSLPAGIFNVLHALRLSNNRLSGGILGARNNGSTTSFNFQYLDLAANSFTGPVPPGIASLVKVSLGANKLTGHIPALSCRGAQLQHLSLENNHLTGPVVPPSLRDCTNLLSYDVSGNQLTGTLPDLLKRWQSLRLLDVSNNRLGGAFPDWLASLLALEYLNVAHNNFSGFLPVARFNAFPAIRKARPSVIHPPADHEASRSEALERYLFWNVHLLLIKPSLDFSDNAFTGGFTSNLGSLVLLKHLDVSRNRLHATIPATLSRITQLSHLNVSRNRLIGSIPPRLTQLSYLTFVDFSFNSLSGPIPQSPKWAAFPVSSFIGNSLCGPPISDRCLG